MFWLYLHLTCTVNSIRCFFLFLSIWHEEVWSFFATVCLLFRSIIYESISYFSLNIKKNKQTKVHTLLRFILFQPNVLFFFLLKNIIQETTLLFRCQVSLGSLGLWQVLRLPLFLMILTILRRTLSFLHSLLRYFSENEVSNRSYSLFMPQMNFTNED